MKRSILLVISVWVGIFIFSCSEESSTGPDNDILKYYPKTVYERSLIDSLDDYYLSEEFIYDSSMQLIRMNDYSSDSSLSQYFKYQYDNEGNLERWDDYEDNGQEHRVKKFIYSGRNSERELERIENYIVEDSEETLYSYNTFVYDDNKCIRTNIFYIEEPDYNGYIEYTYGENDNIVSEVAFDVDGNQEDSEIFYEYDNNFFWIFNILPMYGEYKYPFYYQQNNIAIEHTDNSQFVSTYEYNEDDFPTKITIKRYWNGNYEPGESSELNIEYEVN